MSGAYRYGTVNRLTLGEGRPGNATQGNRDGPRNDPEQGLELSRLVDEQLEQELGPTLAPFAQSIGDYICRRLKAGANDDWVSQRDTTIGPRRHCALVRQMVADGDYRALIDGELFLLRRATMDEARRSVAKPAKPAMVKAKAPDPDSAAVDRINRRLGK